MKSSKVNLCSDYKYIRGRYVLDGDIVTEYGTFVYENDVFIKRKQNN